MKAAPRPAPDCIAAKPFKDFEDCLLDIIQNIEFRQTTNQFQKKLNEEIHKIRQDKNFLLLLIRQAISTKWSQVSTMNY